MFLFRAFILSSAQIHLLTAVDTIDHSCKRIDYLTPLRSALMLAKLLHQVKGLLRDDRLLRILEDKSLVLGIIDDLMHLVGLHVCAEVDRVTAVFIAFKNVADSLRSPTVQFGIVSAVVPTL